jgi:putative SOS response-associated peptidase YedK
MVMTSAQIGIADLHDRMPVILSPDAETTWLSAPIDEALALCRPFPVPLCIERTTEPWAKPR